MSLDHGRWPTPTTSAVKNYLLSSGVSPAEEGLLMFLDVTATPTPTLKVGDADDVAFYGFAVTQDLRYATEAAVENLGIPSSSPYTLTLDLPTGSTLVATQISIYDVTGSATLTEGSASNSGEYAAVDATGVVTFNSAQAGHNVNVYYRYSLTTAMARLLFFESFTNAQYMLDEGEIAVMQGSGQIFTTSFDAADVAAAALGAVVYCDANGLATTTDGGGSEVGVIESKPSTSDKYLGISFIAPRRISA